MTEITLESYDGVLVRVNKEIVLQSELISDILKEKGNDIENPILLENVKYSTLNKVIDYCKHCHQELIYNNNRNNIKYDSWAKDYFKNVNKELLFDLVHAAHTMKINNLLILICKYIAIEIIGQIDNNITIHFRFNDTDDSKNSTPPTRRFTER
ncbi:hypothetical protein BCR36DRAFT_403475 [Piromyces finnis]|uniref:E3 ubiquitin ligase complex SCF subunit n=1 Tax=Piromyces finnis TaxID=1754191 RepID=A0A1Y1VE17_9FUNG|nr:hypothetical protein BCR36DRAFT_403475 [Piromyces finnis]|eukprot:ORX53817.1 hypothetical protein BCR36DRAFT_403475 [Piromyces finnis]